MMWVWELLKILTENKFKPYVKIWYQKILNLTLNICGLKHQASYFSVHLMLCKRWRRIAYIICLFVSPCFCPCKIHITAPEIVHLLPWRKRLFACVIYASLPVEIVSLYICPLGSYLSVHWDNTCSWRLCLTVFLSVGIPSSCPWR